MKAIVSQVVRHWAWQLACVANHVYFSSESSPGPVSWSTALMLWVVWGPWHFPLWHKAAKWLRLPQLSHVFPWAKQLFGSRISPQLPDAFVDPSVSPLLQHRHQPNLLWKLTDLKVSPSLTFFICATVLYDACQISSVFFSVNWDSHTILSHTLALQMLIIKWSRNIPLGVIVSNSQPLPSFLSAAYTSHSSRLLPEPTY